MTNNQVHFKDRVDQWSRNSILFDAIKDDDFVRPVDQVSITSNGAVFNILIGFFQFHKKIQVVIVDFKFVLKMGIKFKGVLFSVSYYYVQDYTVVLGAQNVSFTFI